MNFSFPLADLGLNGHGVKLLIILTSLDIISNYSMSAHWI